MVEQVDLDAHFKQVQACIVKWKKNEEFLNGTDALIVIWVLYLIWRMSDLVVIFHLKFSVFTNADLFHKVQNKKHSSFEGKIRVLYNIFFFFILFIMPCYVNLLWCLLLRYNSVFCEQLTIYCAKTAFIYHNKTCQNSWLAVFCILPPLGSYRNVLSLTWYDLKSSILVCW